MPPHGRPMLQEGRGSAHAESHGGPEERDKPVWDACGAKPSLEVGVGCVAKKKTTDHKNMVNRRVLTTLHIGHRQKTVEEKLIYITKVAATGCKMYVQHW